MDKLKDYAANVVYLARVKPKEVAAFVVIGFLIGLAV